MYTEEEKKFMAYWEENRERRKKLPIQLIVGLPAGVLLVIAIFISFVSGWHRRAIMDFNSNKSIVLVLLLAAVIIVGFVAVFSSRHKWDMNEQHYRELLSRRDNPK